MQNVNQVLTKEKKPDEMLKINALPSNYQNDIVLLPKYKTLNNGKDTCLSLLYILSRKCWAYVLKTGKIQGVL